MDSFKDLVQIRRSHRQFTDKEIDAEDLRLIRMMKLSLLRILLLRFRIFI